MRKTQLKSFTPTAATLNRWLLGWTLVIWLGSAFPARAFVLQRDDRGNRLQVKFSLTPTLTYHLGTSGSVRGNLSNEWVNVRAAVGQWLAVPGTALKFSEGAPIPAISQIPVEDGRVDILWGDPGIPYPLDPSFGGGTVSVANSQVAVTYLFTDGVNTDVILQAIVLIRRDLDYTTTYTEKSANRPFLETVILHELGHVLGANHSPLGTATLWWYSGGGANAAAGLSADDIAFAQSVYGTSATLSSRAKIAGSIRQNGSAVLGALVVAERTNGIVISATVSRANGTYELAGLVPGTFRLRVTPLDPPGSDDASLVRGANLDVTANNEYALANTGFQPAAPLVLTVGANTVSTRDFAVSPATTAPLRITEIRQGFNHDDLASADLALQLAPDQTMAWIGVYVPGLTARDVSLRLSGDGITYGTTEVRTEQTLRNMPLVQVPVTVATTASTGPRTLELTVGSSVIRANGFVEVLPTVPDDNFDGLSDLFQRAYWAPFTQVAAGPLQDPDGDGYLNQREASAGTNPIDPQSFPFRVSARISNGRIIVTGSVLIGKSYQLQVREALLAPWVNLGSPVLAKAESQDFLDDRALSLERYYQIRRVP